MKDRLPFNLLSLVVLPIAAACSGGGEKNPTATPINNLPAACKKIDVPPVVESGLGSTLDQYLIINGLPSNDITIRDGQTGRIFLIPPTLGENKGAALPRVNASITRLPQNHVLFEKDCTPQG